MAKHQLILLKSRRFFPLFITQFLGAFNDNVFKNALIILIAFRLSDFLGLDSQILVAMAGGIFILPFFLFSSTAGQIADKYEKSKLISRIKIAEIILMAMAALGFYLQSIFLLMTVLFFLGTQATFLGPLKYALLPEQLHEGELLSGNSLIEAATFMSILLGTIIGGVLILQHYGDFIISLIIMTIAIIGWSSSRFILASEHRQPDLYISYNFIRETSKSFQYTKEKKDLFLCILGISWFWFFGATFLSELPTFAKDLLQANENVVTFLIAIFTIGLAIGSLICNRISKGKTQIKHIPLSILAMALFTLDLFFCAAFGTFNQQQELISLGPFLSTRSGLRITIDLTFIAIFGGLYTLPLYAIIQERCERSHCARVLAFNNIMNALFMVLSALAIMVMAMIGFSVLHVFLLLTFCNLFVAAFIYKKLFLIAS